MLLLQQVVLRLYVLIPYVAEAIADALENKSLPADVVLPT